MRFGGANLQVGGTMWRGAAQWLMKEFFPSSKKLGMVGGRRRRGGGDNLRPESYLVGSDVPGRTQVVD